MTDVHLPLLMNPRSYTWALFSPCGVYRYHLGRVWDPMRPRLGLVMLNPSKADGRRNDATIRRCMRFAAMWGYGGIVVRNLYALVSTDPHQLWNHADPVGPDNDAELALCSEHDLTVLAWGANAAPDRAHEVAAMLWESSRQHGTSLAVMGWTASGQPRHPVRMRKDTVLECVTPASSGDTHETEDPRWGQLFYSVAA